MKGGIFGHSSGDAVRKKKTDEEIYLAESPESADNSVDPDLIDVIWEPNIESEEDFIAHCHGWFLSKTTIVLISEEDFTGFLCHLCDILHDEKLAAFDCPCLAFSALDGHIQDLLYNEVGQAVDRVNSLCCGLLPFMRLLELEPNFGRLLRN